MSITKHRIWMDPQPGPGVGGFWPRDTGVTFTSEAHAPNAQFTPCGQKRWSLTLQAEPVYDQGVWYWEVWEQR